MTNREAARIIRLHLEDGAQYMTDNLIDALDHACLVLSEAEDRRQRDLVGALDILHGVLQTKRGTRFVRASSSFII